MMAESIRRKLHGTTATFVRVADVSIGQDGADLRPSDIPAASGEVRLFDTPSTLAAAVSAVTLLRSRAGATPVSAFCLFELSKLSEGLPVVLRTLKQAGSGLVERGPLERLDAPRLMPPAGSRARGQLSPP